MAAALSAFRGGVLAFAGALAAADAGGTGTVPVRIVDRPQAYPVEAADARGIGREMAERGPQHPTGRRAWAYTAWDMRANYDLAKSRDACRLQDASVVLTVTTTLPEWRPRRPTSTTLRQSWWRMLAAARAHESMHRMHGIEAAHVAAREIARVEPAAGCAELERHVRRVLRRAVDAGARRSRQFDLDTDYGRRDGVGLAE